MRNTKICGSGLISTTIADSTLMIQVDPQACFTVPMLAGISPTLQASGQQIVSNSGGIFSIVSIV